MRIHLTTAAAMLAMSTPATPTPPSTPMSIIGSVYLPLQGCHVEMARTGPLRDPPAPSGPAAYAALGSVLPSADRAWPDMTGGPSPWGTVPIQDVGPGRPPRLAPSSKGYSFLPMTAVSLILRTPSVPQAVLVKAHGVAAPGGTRVIALRTEGAIPPIATPTYTVTHVCPKQYNRTFPAERATIGTIWSDRELPADFPRRIGRCGGLASECAATLPKGRVLLHSPYAEGYHPPPVASGVHAASSLWLDLDRVAAETDGGTRK